MVTQITIQSLCKNTSSWTQSRLPLRPFRSSFQVLFIDKYQRTTILDNNSEETDKPLLTICIHPIYTNICFHHFNLRQLTSCKSHSSGIMRDLSSADRRTYRVMCGFSFDSEIILGPRATFNKI